MPIRIIMLAERSYTAEISPPHRSGGAETLGPLPLRDLFNELRERGYNGIDIVDAMYAADKDWKAHLD
jgi:hypothetical protein